MEKTEPKYRNYEILIATQVIENESKTLYGQESLLRFVRMASVTGYSCKHLSSRQEKNNLLKVFKEACEQYPPLIWNSINTQMEDNDFGDYFPN